MRTSAIFDAKTSEFFRNLWCVRTTRGVEPVQIFFGQGGRGSIFRDFVLRGRPFVARLSQIFPFSPIFGQLSIFNWPPIPLSQKLLIDTGIFADIFNQSILVKIGVDSLQSRLTAA